MLGREYTARNARGTGGWTSDKGRFFVGGAMKSRPGVRHCGVGRNPGLFMGPHLALSVRALAGQRPGG